MACGAGAAVASWPSIATAQTSRAPINATAINDHLHLFSGSGGNVLLVSSGEGLVLVNGGSAERSNELLKTISSHTQGKRLTTLFNTDWCADHTGSNEAIGSIGVQIIAHENTKQYLANEQFVEWQKRTYPAKPKV